MVTTKEEYDFDAAIFCLNRSTVVTIRGLKATEEGKPAAVKVSFKVRKTGKTSKYSYASKVNVVEDKYSIASAEVAGAKTINVTLNKAIADATAVKVAVKKGATAKDSTFTAEGTKIVITTDTKLIAGSYTVTVSGLEETDLTATVDVAKDETLTSYEIGKELIANADASTKGSIYYKALNQYGEMMTADAPQVTCSFTSVTPVVAVTATANREGRIDVSDINTALAILGTKGTVVLVDQNLGVNATGEVTYSAAATAAEAKVEGMYNTAKSAFQDITAKDDADSYYLLMTITDQYGHQLSYDDIKNDVSITIAGGITNVESNQSGNADTAKGLKDFTIGGKDYIAAILTDGGKTVAAGSSTVTMVNNKRGLLLSHTIEVIDYVIVSSFVVSADNGVYNNQDNTMSYEATDTNGNAITSYAVLNNLIGLPNNQWKWQKNADGTAKLTYHPVVNITTNNSHTASTLVAAVFSCNDPTSQNFAIKTQNFTIRQDREPVTVQGLAADAVTQFSASAGSHKIDLNKIVYADQYANKVTKDDSIYANVTSVTTAAVTSAGACGVKIVTSAGMEARVSGSAFEFESTTKSATATVYLKLYNDIANDGLSAVSTTKYDYKFVVTCVDTEGVDASAVKISKINSGNVEKVGKASSSALTVDKIDVVATIAGVETKLNSSQYIIKSIENGSFTVEEQNKGVNTKTATVTIQVTTFDNNNNPTVVELKGDYEISYADPYANSIKDVSDAGKAAMASSGDAIVTTGASLTAQDMQGMFIFKDQYGAEMVNVTSADAIQTKVAYNIVPKEDRTNTVKVYGENSNKVYATGAAGTKYLLTITATPANGKAVTKDIWVQFKA